MPSSLQTGVEEYFTEQFGLPLAALLAPITAQQPAGPSLRGSPLYGAIEKARRQDDPSVPLGAWEYELKRADWGQVSTLTLQALQQSKDLFHPHGSVHARLRQLRPAVRVRERHQGDAEPGVALVRS